MSALRPIRELAEQIRGVTYGKGDASSRPVPGSVAVLRAGNIQDLGLTLTDLVYIPRARVSDGQFLREHDVLIATSSGSLDVVGKAARVTRDLGMAFGAFCKVLRPGHEIDPRYFAHYFRTARYRKTISRLAAGANINNLRTEHLDDLQMPVPNREDQHRIADILDKADAIWARRREAMTLTQGLLRSTFLDMFGDPVVNPKGWAVRALGEVADTSSGGTPSRTNPHYYGGPIPWVKSGELHQRVVTSTEETLTQLGIEKSSARLVPAGTVLIAMYGATAGAVSVLGVPAATNQAVCAISTGPSLDPPYLSCLLEQMAAVLLRKRVGGAQPNLSQELIRGLRIPVPPMDYQARFARSKSLIDKVGALQSEAEGRSKDLFAALMQRSFTRLSPAQEFHADRS